MTATRIEIRRGIALCLLTLCLAGGGNVVQSAELRCIGYTEHGCARFGSICPEEVPPDTACWLAVDNQRECFVWISSGDYRIRYSSVRWSGECADGLANGRGEEERDYHLQERGETRFEKASSRAEGPYVEGKRHGRWFLRSPDGRVDEGPFVDGKAHGHWIIRAAGGLGLVEGGG